jgi:hypothetical protein
LKGIDPEAPLPSIEIGRALYALAPTMLQDVGGWARGRDGRWIAERYR